MLKHEESQLFQINTTDLSIVHNVVIEVVQIWFITQHGTCIVRGEEPGTVKLLQRKYI